MTMTYHWLEPWASLLESQQGSLQDELRHELTPAHPLYNIPLTPLGKHGGTDDVLFQLPDQRLVVVHLTWAGRGDRQYPRAKFFKNWADFAANRMEPDYADYK